MKKSIAFALTTLCSIPFIASAHPGHGDTDGFTITHYFVEPDHAVITLAIVGAMTYLLIRRRNARKEKA